MLVLMLHRSAWKLSFWIKNGKKGKVWNDWNNGDNWNVEKMEKRFLGLRYRATKNPHKSILNKNQWVISSPSFKKIRRFTTFLSTLCNLRTMVWNKLDTNREKVIWKNKMYRKMNHAVVNKHKVLLRLTLKLAQ